MIVKVETITDNVAALMNDTEKGVYIFAKVLPYLNMALTDLQEIFEQNSIPVTQKISGIRQINASTSNTLNEVIPPTDLVEINLIWESARDLNQWIPMIRWLAIPEYMLNAPTNMLIGWVYRDGKIILLPSNANNDIKIDYTGSLFVPMTNAGQSITLPNVQSYLQYHTAALCSLYVGENETRASTLEKQANDALDRSLGISTKGQQAITIRRRPFMAAYKRRSAW